MLVGGKIVKRAMRLLVTFSIICVFVLSTTAYSAGSRIVVSNPVCDAGEEVLIEINLPANTGVVSVQLEIEYDKELTLVEVVDAGILGETNHSNNYRSPYVLSWENDHIKENITSTGKIATLKFIVDSDAVEKDYPIIIVRAEVLDKDINDVDCTVTNGKIKVKEKENNVTGIPRPSSPSTGGFSEDELSSEPEKFVDEQPVVENEATTPQKNQVSFMDVSTNDWFYTYVIELAEKNIILGIGNNAFAPTDNVTREQFLKMLLLAANVSVESEINTFTDVNDDAWYKDYVLTAKKKGIVNGVSETEFGIGSKITRQDMAVMISRTIEKLGLKSDAGQSALFADDGKVSGYAKDSVTYMRDIGLIEGYNNEFRPLDSLTRAEAAKVISELLKLI